MNTKNKQELYTSPEAEVIEMKSNQVICDSLLTNDTSLEDMPETDLDITF